MRKRHDLPTHVPITGGYAIAVPRRLRSRHCIVLALSTFGFLVCVYLFSAPDPYPLVDLPVFYVPPQAPAPDLPAPVLLHGKRYHAFTGLSAEDALPDAHVRPIRAHERISDECLDVWVSSGKWQLPCTREMVRDARIDLVYLWVNGSDPLHVSARAALQTELGFKAEDARYREHDELKYALRAARIGTQHWIGSRWHIVTNDVADPQHPDKRFGQLPQWLDVQCAIEGHNATASTLGQPPILVHHDNELFRYTPTGGTTADSDKWLKRVLPSFNSHAVESQLAHLDPDVVSENIVALNDDQMIVRPLPPSAFHSPLYGPVFRFDGQLFVGGDSTGAGDASGEWRSIPWSNHVLDTRFGERKRAYIQHHARALSLPLLHEASLAFGAEFAHTPLSRFRGSHDVHGEWELNTMFFASHYVAERHREALLWSWIVGKWGGRTEGRLDESTKELMWSEVGGKGRKRKDVQIWSVGRSYIDVEDNMKRAGLQGPATGRSGGNPQVGSQYGWVSMNGFYQSWRQIPNQEPNVRGFITFNECMKPATESAWALFRRFATVDTHCGDIGTLPPHLSLCRMLKSLPVISKLVQSQRSGLGVFLPDVLNRNTTSQRVVPNPLTLPLVVSSTPVPLPPDLRLFAVRLIHRYSYAIGRSPDQFVRLLKPKQAEFQLRNLAMRKPALICINDDFGDDEEVVREGDKVLRKWLQEKWPEPLVCEL
ncbi:unnamed protein product [Mycena citricolor]|uniref:Stealth protein CR1 conserved region 1 domain-containing protein n=1 Tax=Mycena citricolor TaxID=2018698 RepID=A0AAD2JZV9_9AGAR|nr:unnamed protein product [Mycena citricolor]